MKKLILTCLFVIVGLTSFAVQNIEQEIENLNFQCTIVVQTYDGNGQLINETHYHTDGSCSSLLRQIR